MKNLYTIWFSIFLCLSNLLVATDTNNEIPTVTFEHIKQSAASWVTSCASLTPEHLELLANVLYLSYRHAHLDEQTSKAFSLLKKTFPSVRLQLRNYENISPIITTYTHASKRFFTFYTLRHHMYLSWQHCTRHVEAIDDPLLQNAFEQLRKNGQTIIGEYVACCTTASIVVPSLQQHIQHAINQLHAIEYVTTALFEKINTNTQPVDAILDLDRLNNISHRMQTITDTMHQPLEVIDNYQTNLLSVSTHLFHKYYSALYSLLPAGNQRFLFGPHGILLEQNQYKLPPPIFS